MELQFMEREFHLKFFKELEFLTEIRFLENRVPFKKLEFMELQFMEREFHLKFFKELEFLTEIRFLENRVSKQGHFARTFVRKEYFAILACIPTYYLIYIQYHTKILCRIFYFFDFHKLLVNQNSLGDYIVSINSSSSR